MADSGAQSVVTIGNFEAVHAGHLALLRRAREIADGSTPALRVVVITFDPHPGDVIRGLVPRTCIQPIERRVELLKEHGADDVVVIEPTAGFLSLEPEAFVERVVREYNPACIVEGDDFRFGRARAGDVTTLGMLADEHGFDVQVVAEVDIDLSDQTIVRASSTMTRWLIERGRVEDAARVLTRPHELVGTVVPGDARGRAIGFPTANLDTPCLLPADGVYAGEATLPDGSRCPAAVHVGPRRTFDDVRRTVEAHLIGWTAPDPENPHEYGWSLRIGLSHFLRGQAKFEGVDALVEQIRRDVDRTLERMPMDRKETVV